MNLFGRPVDGLIAGANKKLGPVRMFGSAWDVLWAVPVGGRSAVLRSHAVRVTDRFKMGAHF